jgi:hypothetical protein
MTEIRNEQLLVILLPSGPSGKLSIKFITAGTHGIASNYFPLRWRITGDEAHWGRSPLISHHWMLASCKPRQGRRGSTVIDVYPVDQLMVRSINQYLVSK